MRSLTRTEGVDVLIELEPHYCPIVVNDVGLPVPGARYHLLSAVSLETNTHPRHDSQNKWKLSVWCNFTPKVVSRSECRGNTQLQ